MTVTGFLGSVQNCSNTGEKASLLLSNCRRRKIVSAHHKKLLLLVCLHMYNESPQGGSTCVSSKTVGVHYILGHFTFVALKECIVCVLF